MPPKLILNTTNDKIDKRSQFHTNLPQENDIDIPFNQQTMSMKDEERRSNGWLTHYLQISMITLLTRHVCIKKKIKLTRRNRQVRRKVWKYSGDHNLNISFTFVFFVPQMLETWILICTITCCSKYLRLASSKKNWMELNYSFTYGLRTI